MSSGVMSASSRTLARAATLAAASWPSRSYDGSVSANPASIASATASCIVCALGHGVEHVVGRRVQDAAKAEHPVAGQAELGEVVDRAAVHRDALVAELPALGVGAVAQPAVVPGDRALVDRDDVHAGVEGGVDVGDREFARRA